MPGVTKSFVSLYGPPRLLLDRIRKLGLDHLHALSRYEEGAAQFLGCGSYLDCTTGAEPTCDTLARQGVQEAAAAGKHAELRITPRRNHPPDRAALSRPVGASELNLIVHSRRSISLTLTLPQCPVTVSQHVFLCFRGPHQGSAQRTQHLLRIWQLPEPLPSRPKPNWRSSPAVAAAAS